MTTLSICIPSHAPLSAAQTSIDSALALLPYGDIEVVVSDNSEDEQKAAYYGLLQRDSELLESIDWQGVVIDEAQAIKNPASESAKAARATWP